MVFVMSAEGVLETRAVVAGARDWEFTEIIEGLVEGDMVVMLPSTALLEGQERIRNFVRGRTGGIPGMGGGMGSGRPPSGGRGRGR